MWRLLTEVNATKQSAIVLTTHNMLECESVCTRVGVMKNGELVVLGSSQHLRSTHGTGYLLEVSLTSGTPSAIAELKSFVQSNFKGAVVVDEHGSMVNYEVPRSGIERLSAAFRLLEENKARLSIADYSLSQSTLEQVFLKQIRPSNEETSVAEAEKIGGVRKPLCRDYFWGYFIWLLSFALPGFHHFYLGNTMRGLKYLFTLNELWVGWFLDLFELHVLIRTSVEEYGNSTVCTKGGFCGCCCCTSKVSSQSAAVNSSSYSAPR
jgi:TM2 domain-containing membrane protein YozV